MSHHQGQPWRCGTHPAQSLGFGLMLLISSAANALNGHGYLEPEARFIRSDGPFSSVSDQLALHDTDARLGATLDLATAEFSVQGDLEWSAHDHQNPSWILREGFWQHSLGSALELSLGRKKVSWGSGYAFRPTDVLNPGFRRDDPQDLRQRVKGQDLILLQYYHATGSLELAYGHPEAAPTPQDTGFNQVRWGAKLGLTLDQADINLVTALDRDSNPALGFNFSQILRDDLEWHGDFLWGRDNQRAYHPSVLGSPSNTLYTGSPYVRSEQDSRHYFLQATLGTQFTHGNWNVLLEGLYDERGLSASQYQQWLDNVEFHEQALSLPGLNAAAKGNLSDDARTLTRSGAMRRYLFFRLAHTTATGSPELRLLVNTHDQSAVLSGNLHLQYNDTTEWLLYGEAFLGDARSEYGLSPIQAQLGLQLRIHLP